MVKKAAGALRTLGIARKLEVRVIQAKRVVKLVYHPCLTNYGTINALRWATEDPGSNHVEVLIYPSTHGVIMTDRLTENIDRQKARRTSAGHRTLVLYPCL